MKRKLSLMMTLMLAMLAIGVATPAPTLATGRNCYGDNNNLHDYLLKNGVGRIDSVEADVFIGPLTPCLNGASGDSLVLPLNLQHYSAGFLAQFGYGVFGSWSNNTPDWLFTPDVCSSPIPGATYRASSLPDPIIGHTYRITLSYVASSSRFRAWVDDYSDGLGNPAGIWYDANPCLTYGNEAWAGFEIWDSGDTLGGDGQWVAIENLQYENQGSDVGIYWTDSNGTEWWYNVGGTMKSWHHHQVYNTTNNRRAIRAYTS